MSELRQKILDEVKRVVIKVGSRVLVDSDRGGVRLDYIRRLAGSIAHLMNNGKEVVLVTSGAVGAGMAVLGYTKKPAVMAEKQACAAVGQIDLMHAYREEFRKLNIAAGQILLSADDFRDRSRYKNLQNTFQVMLSKKIIPIVNENDSVAVSEIKVGDNDKLSSDVALFIDADLLLIFTDEDGLYDDNPKKNPNARLLHFVPKITPEIMALAGAAGETGSAISTGGMKSKLESIRAAVNSGCSALLGNGFKVLPHEFFESETHGTFFAGNAKKIGSRHRWLSFVSTPRGAVVVDDGAVKALREKHSSLLPVGIADVRKNFARGDLIEVLDASGNRLARGISQYASSRLSLIQGKKTAEVRTILGKETPEEVIHKNDLVLF
ncbi:MAG: glutamate 5-kinase [Fibrobacter sp.]|nr:glutamate 5-kinase [Fibrobacter sp.]